MDGIESEILHILPKEYLSIISNNGGADRKPRHRSESRFGRKKRGAACLMFDVRDYFILSYLIRALVWHLVAPLGRPYLACGEPTRFLRQWCDCRLLFPQRNLQEGTAILGKTSKRACSISL